MDQANMLCSFIYAQKRYYSSGPKALKHTFTWSKHLYIKNTIKICDFGWAVHSPLMRNTQCGTPLYNPPEVV